MTGTPRGCIITHLCVSQQRRLCPHPPCAHSHTYRCPRPVPLVLRFGVETTVSLSSNQPQTRRVSPNLSALQLSCLTTTALTTYRPPRHRPPSQSRTRRLHIPLYPPCTSSSPPQQPWPTVSNLTTRTFPLEAPTLAPAGRIRMATIAQLPSKR